MGLFRKESKTHFERDEAGNVVSVTRNGEDVTDQRGWKSSEQLEREYYKLHPEEKHKTFKKIGSFAASIDRKIVAHNRRTAPRSKFQGFSTPQYSTRNNYNPFGSMFDTGMKPMKMPKSQSKQKFAVIGGKAYPIAGSKKKGKRKSTRRKTMGGFDMMDNWGFFK